MGLNLYVVLGSAVVGLLVGLTGAGGGALMTPMLILLFSVKPAAAISSDLVAAVVMRPVGAAVHLHKGTVNLRLVGWMSLGSVPMAFLGAYLLREMGNSSADAKNVEIALGAALLIGAAAMVLRYVLDRRSTRPRTGKIAEVARAPGADRADRHGRRADRRHHLGGLGLADDHPAAVRLPDAQRRPAGRDRPDSGSPAHRGGGPGRADLRPRRVRRHRVDHRRQRARGADRLAALVPGAGPVHQAGHHLRDPRVRPEVRRRPHLPAGLDHGRHPAGRRGVLAGHEAPLAAGPAAGRRGHGASPALAPDTQPTAKRADATADPLDDVPVR